MPAEDRAQQRRAPAVPSPSGVPMSELLASCVAADAVSKPPSDGVEETGPSGPGDLAPPERDAA